MTFDPVHLLTAALSSSLDVLDSSNDALLLLLDAAGPLDLCGAAAAVLLFEVHF